MSGLVTGEHGVSWGHKNEWVYQSAEVAVTNSMD